MSVSFDSIISFVQEWNCDDYIIFGDFNSVIQSSERCGINGFDSAYQELVDLMDNLLL